MELNAEGIETYQTGTRQRLLQKPGCGEFFADLLIPNQLIIELKAVRELAKEHEVQVVNLLERNKN